MSHKGPLMHCRSCGCISDNGFCDCTRMKTGKRNAVYFTSEDLKLLFDTEKTHHEAVVAKLRQQIMVAAQWCTDACCEFKKDTRAFAPSIEQFADNFEKMVERK